jgi:hypothetical protein
MRRALVRSREDLHVLIKSTCDGQALVGRPIVNQNNFFRRERLRQNRTDRLR